MTDIFRKYKYIFSILGLLVFYILTGIYILENGQSALIIRIGKNVDEVSRPGIHFSLPYPFDKVMKVHVSRVKKVKIFNRTNIEEPVDDIKNKYKNFERIKGIEFFTGDENLICIKAIVNYDIKDLGQYMLRTSSPGAFIEAMMTTCISEEIAGRKVDKIMTTGKATLKLILNEKLQISFNKSFCNDIFSKNIIIFNINRIDFSNILFNLS